MTPKQTQLVQESLHVSLPMPTGSLRLSTRGCSSSIRRCGRSKGNMASQGRKLVDMMGTVVMRLTALEAVVPTIQALGARHAGYGVKAVHYESVGAALLCALEKELGGGRSHLRYATPGRRPTALIANTMKVPATSHHS